MILLYHLLTHSSILNRIYFNSTVKQNAPASPIKGRRSNESPRQIATPTPCPAGHTSDGNSHGCHTPRLDSPSAGNCHGAEPTFDPALYQGTDNQPAPSVAGQRVTEYPCTHFNVKMDRLIVDAVFFTFCIICF